MLNTGLRTGEMLGVLNSDVDLEKKVIHIRQGVKEVRRRDGAQSTSGKEIKIGKLKSASSKRDVPLNATAIAMIEVYARSSTSGRIRPLYAMRTAITQDR